MKKAKEFRDQSLQELDIQYNDARKELFNLVNRSKITKKREKPHEIKHLRKDIARLLTVMTEKRHQEQNESH